MVSLSRRGWLLLVGLVVVAGGVVLVASRYPNRLPTSWPVWGRPPVPDPAEAPAAVPPGEIEPLVLSLEPQPPAVTPDLLAAGAPVVYAFYWFPNLPEPAAPRLQWSRDGEDLGSLPADRVNQISVAGGVRGSATLPAPGGSLPAGIYEVQITVGTRTVGGSFVAVWGADEIVTQQSPATAEMSVTQAVIAAGVKADGSPQGPLKTLRDGRQRVYLVFAFQNAEPGSAVVVKWSANGHALSGAGREVVLPAAAGWGHAWLQAQGPEGLPAAEYRATVMLAGDDRELAAATVQVTEP
jgi:hypothetical protein